MGTRNLICVVRNGEFKVAQYCQWDGYPSGQGSTACHFVVENLTTPDGLKQFIEKIDALQPITHKEIAQLWNDIGANDSGFVSFGISRLMLEKYPEYHRNTGAKILDLILNRPFGMKISKALEFAADSLFCEWCYVIDLDTMNFEIYRGFNKEKLPENARFAFLNEKSEKDNDHRDNIYYPVRLIAEFGFSQLEPDTLKNFKLEEE